MGGIGNHNLGTGIKEQLSVGAPDALIVLALTIGCLDHTEVRFLNRCILLTAVSASSSSPFCTAVISTSNTPAIASLFGTAMAALAFSNSIAFCPYLTVR